MSQQTQAQKTLTKPNPAQVFIQQRQNTKSVQEETKQLIKTGINDYIKTAETLHASENEKLTAAKNECKDAVAASLVLVEEKAKKVEEAKLILLQAQDDLKYTQARHNGVVKTLSQKFNRAASDIHQSLTNEKYAALKAHQDFIAQQKRKMRKAKGAGHSAVAAEVAALAHYSVFAAADTTVRVANGVKAIAGSLTTAFKQGYDNGGMNPPAKLLKRQQKPSQTPEV